MNKKDQQLNQIILDEIARITENNSVNNQVLEDFAFFVINNHKKKLSKKIKPLSLSDLKKAVYQCTLDDFIEFVHHNYPDHQPELTVKLQKAKKVLGKVS
ncbi:MAG: hypothetical protein AB4057_10445 [Crocosphaera sp.]